MGRDGAWRDVGAARSALTSLSAAEWSVWRFSVLSLAAVFMGFCFGF